MSEPKNSLNAKNLKTNNVHQITAITPDIKNADEKDDLQGACILCWKNFEIYSIGECDHAICYECSARMRVLCNDRTCPICRHYLPKVIFTHIKLPFSELEGKRWRHQCYNRKYQITFGSRDIEREFFRLIEHPCPKCNIMPFWKFSELENHVYEKHNLYYCEICTEHLRNFTSERRCYTRAELELHRSTGDVDDSSMRGHPLCKFCHKRFLDKDELYRHMRRIHYYCHLCDDINLNQFYFNYDELADHFRLAHFLCEIGQCRKQEFTCAFRTEIELKAHIAKEHAEFFNKHEAKQMRQLNMNTIFEPQIHMSNKTSKRISTSGVASTSSVTCTQSARYVGPQNQSIDIRNEAQFPALNNDASRPNVSFIRTQPKQQKKLIVEAFPALGENIRKRNIVTAKFVREEPSCSTARSANAFSFFSAGSQTAIKPSGSNRKHNKLPTTQPLKKAISQNVTTINKKHKKNKCEVAVQCELHRELSTFDLTEIPLQPKLNKKPLNEIQNEQQSAPSTSRNVKAQLSNRLNYEADASLKNYAEEFNPATSTTSILNFTDNDFPTLNQVKSKKSLMQHKKSQHK